MNQKRSPESQGGGEELDMDMHWEQLLCDDLSDAFGSDVVVIKGGAKYFSPFLFRNPRYQKLMAEWFIDGAIARPLSGPP